MDAVRQVYLDTAHAFLALVEGEGIRTKWATDSALAGFTVGGLVAHTLNAIGWLSSLVTAPPPSDGRREIALGKYYAGMKISTDEDFGGGIHAGLRMLGAHTAERGRDAVVEDFRSEVKRQHGQLAEQPADRVLDMRPTIPATIALDDFVRTRILELVVHGDDLAVSVGVDFDVPPSATAATISTLVATATHAHGDVAVIRALSRRERANPDVFPVF
jgi:uncharacterized protein (TIGR03083 family)